MWFRLKDLGITELMEEIIETLPSPDAAGTVKAEVPGKGETVELKASRDEALSTLVFKTMADPFVGKLTLFRVYSGVVKSDSPFLQFLPEPGGKDRAAFLNQREKPDPRFRSGGRRYRRRCQITGDSDRRYPLQPRDRPGDLAGNRFSQAPPGYGSLSQRKERRGEDQQRFIPVGGRRSTITVEKDTTTKELILAGLGDLHLEVITSKLQKKFGVEVDTEDPKVPYRETIRGTRQGRRETQEAIRRPWAVRPCLAGGSNPCRPAQGLSLSIRFSAGPYRSSISGGKRSPGNHGRGDFGRLSRGGYKGDLVRRFVPQCRLLGDGL